MEGGLREANGDPPVLKQRERESIITGVTLISQERTGPSTQIDKWAFGEHRDICSIVTGRIVRVLSILVSS